ncbi:Lipoyltransferase 1, mitochondrial [Schistosoma japonicum]|nr:Lipoyltransferase 1, mitochondrial [Schistosoma japonicum]
MTILIRSNRFCIKLSSHINISTFYQQFTTWNQIFLLNSNDIYRNLAFEECLYYQYEKQLNLLKIDQLPWFTKILLWRNNPCIVIGRFQNVWKEVNLPLLYSNNIKLARRYSGGGTVYHDLGNLNITFIQPKRYMNRQQCMEFLQSVLQRLLISSNYLIHIGGRYDLWITEKGTSTSILQNKSKISGSSSKFGANMAYHHCTLLFDANLNNLSEVLKPTFVNLQTKATDSIQSPVKNLNVNIDILLNGIIEDGLKWISSKNDVNASNPIVTNVLEGQESQFIHSMKDFEQTLTSLKTWSWIYGSSPRFQLALEDYEPNLSHLTSQFGSIILDCDRGGIFKSIGFIDSQRCTSHSLKDFLSDVTSCLHGAECRTNSWDSILDHFISRKVIHHLNYENIPDEQLLIIKALKMVSSLF